jgi:hypothetical protein
VVFLSARSDAFGVYLGFLVVGAAIIGVVYLYQRWRGPASQKDRANRGQKRRDDQ